MVRNLLFLICLILTNLSSGQDSDSELKMMTSWGLDNNDIAKVFRFQGIDYHKITFTGSDLKEKSFKVTAKEFMDGNVISDKVIVNSQEMPFENLKKINDTIFPILVLSKQTDKTTLKMEFVFPRYSFSKEFKVLEMEDKYSLANIASDSKMEIEYNKKFYLLAYVLPYHRNDGSGVRSYCDVRSNGTDMENWGKKFGIKHYWTFEMEFF